MKIRTLLAQPLVLVALRLFMGILFLYASIDKILHPAAFAETVANYHMVPHPLINLFALLLPMLELVTGVLILAGIWSLEAATIALALLVSFIVALAQGMARGLDFHCGCFTQEGASTDPANWLTVLRDVGFVVAGVLLILAERRTATWSLLRDPLGKRRESY